MTGAPRQTFALLLMDYQEAMCAPTGRVGAAGLADEVGRRGVLEAASRVLAACRRRDDVAIVHVRVAFDAQYHRMTSGSKRFAYFRHEQMLIEGSPEAGIRPEVAPAPGEPVINKGCVNPFVGTSLASVLIGAGVRTLVLGGVATEHVVESTARYAADLGYDVIVLEDLCASSKAEWHEVSIGRVLPSYATVLSSTAFLSGDFAATTQ